MCVCLGGDEAISKLKGAGATHALSRSYLHVSCLPWPVLYTVSLKQTPTVPFLILNANSVRHSLEANSEIRCKCISKFIRGYPTGPPPSLGGQTQ